MNLIKTCLISIVLLLFCGNSFTANRQREAVDVVFCLDLSGSTNGLLDDIRERIWEVINEVNSYRPSPEFRIGIVGYGRPSFGAKMGYVKVLQDLTTDYDLLLSELYKLKPAIEKGDQMVGEALRVSVRNMNWSENKNALKTIYLVGNGMVHLGMTNYRDMCDMSVTKGIVINSVYCRTRNNAERELPGWREIARLTGGEQLDIRIHKRPPMLLTSPDAETLKALSGQLSATYLYFGSQGRERYKMMAAIDKYARESNLMTHESRLFYKISDRYQYHQSSWDLIDYIRQSGFSGETLEMQYLPDTLKFRRPEEVGKFAGDLKDQRNRTIIEMRKHLPYDRQATISRMLEERGIDKSDMLERVVINSLNKMAESKGFSTGASASIEFRR